MQFIHLWDSTVHWVPCANPQRLQIDDEGRVYRRQLAYMPKELANGNTNEGVVLRGGLVAATTPLDSQRRW